MSFGDDFLRTLYPPSRLDNEARAMRTFERITTDIFKRGQHRSCSEHDQRLSVSDQFERDAGR